MTFLKRLFEKNVRLVHSYTPLSIRTRFAFFLSKNNHWVLFHEISRLEIPFLSAKFRRL